MKGRKKKHNNSQRIAPKKFVCLNEKKRKSL
jgi:hypothetical protein